MKCLIAGSLDYIASHLLVSLVDRADVHYWGYNKIDSNIYGVDFIDLNSLNIKQTNYDLTYLSKENYEKFDIIYYVEDFNKDPLTRYIEFIQIAKMAYETQSRLIFISDTDVVENPLLNSDIIFKNQCELFLKTAFPNKDLNWLAIRHTTLYGTDQNYFNYKRFRHINVIDHVIEEWDNFRVPIVDNIDAKLDFLHIKDFTSRVISLSKLIDYRDIATDVRTGRFFSLSELACKYNFFIKNSDNQSNKKTKDLEASTIASMWTPMFDIEEYFEECIRKFR